MLCKFCSLDFKSQSYSDYQEHILTHKNSRGLFECPINLCSKTYKSWSHLCEHFFTHDSSAPKPHLCSYCSYTSITRANVRKHEIAVHEDPERRDFECPECSKRFKTASNLNDHLRVHANETFKCNHCDKTFKSNIGLQQHQRLHTGNLFACGVCGEKFQSKHSANRHEKDIHGVYSSSAPDKISKCSKKGCEAEFSSEEDYRVHVRTAHKAGSAAVLICHLCTKICPTRGSLRQHFRKMHGTAAAGVAPASGKSASGKSGQGRNKSLLKQEKLSPKLNKTAASPSPQMHAASAAVTAVTAAGVSVSNSSVSLQNYSCDICHKTFATCYARDKHVSTHEQGQHTCPHCHVDQPSRIVLNMHTKYCKSRTDTAATNDIVIYVNNS